MDPKTTNILLVEDNPVDVLVLREELSGLPGAVFTVSTVESLSEAIEVLTRATFDVVLLDLGLPDSRGLDTFLELQRRAPDAPIVVMSGLDDESLAVEAVRNGAQDYLVKDKYTGVSLSRSITYAIERQQLLVRLKNTERSLRQSEERFRAIFEGAQDSIYIKDRDLKLTHANPAMARIFGRSPESLVGQSTYSLYEPETAKHIKEIDLRVVSGETVEEERTLSVGEASYIFSTYKVPLRDASGNIVGLCGISRDVTERKRADVKNLEPIEEYSSPAMKRTLRMAHMAAQKNAIVLLLGESGAGKDYLARFIHDHSKRSGGPYFSLNCAAIAPQLAESELFGHEKGAFTGAQGRKRGLLELAEGGTLLLNEIGELPLHLQAKLLTFLDTRRYTRVGGEKEVSVDARLIVATNRDLEQEVEAGRFRKDLFYRINVLSITVPPLRERREDIPLLVRSIISRLRTELRVATPPVIDPVAMEQLKGYDWPGNVRELRNVLERAIILWDGKPFKFAGLGAASDSREQDHNGWSFNTPFPVKRTLNDVTQDLKRSLVLEALRRSNGARQGAARLLGISRYSLKHYLKHLGLAEDDKNE